MYPTKLRNKHLNGIKLNILVKFLYYYGRFYAILPLAGHAKVFEVTIDSVLWIFHACNNLMLQAGVLAYMYQAKSDASMVLKSCVEFIACVEVLAILSFCKMKRSRLQMLMKILKNVIQRADSEKIALSRKIGRSYVELYAACHVLIMSILSIYVFKAIRNKETLLSTYYPLLLNSPTGWLVVYVHHLLNMSSTFSILYTDGLIFLLLFVAVVELRLLQVDFERTDEYSSLRSCIDKHYRIIWYVDEVNYFSRFFVVKSIGSLGAYFVVAGLKLLTSDTSTEIRLQFLSYFALACARIYMYAFCSQKLIQSGYDLGKAVYFSQWERQNRNMIVAKSIIIFRCQKSLTVSIPGILSSLDMRYLSRFLYVMFSYVMTLRTILISKK